LWYETRGLTEGYDVILTASDLLAWSESDSVSECGHGFKDRGQQSVYDRCKKFIFRVALLGLCASAYGRATILCLLGLDASTCIL